MTANEAPRGLLGIRPHIPVGVAVTVGIKAAKTGQPIRKDCFWMMSSDATLGEFQGGNRSYKSPVRTPHPDFAAWNQKAKEGPDGVSSIRGNFVHADWRQAALWNRSAHKLPEPNSNPPSLRPACEGNGVSARRYRGLKDGEEVFEKIACPNDLCPFAMEQGSRPALCKPFASLIFRLRWNPADPFESQFPGMLAKWSTRGWHAASGLIGLLELILGTEAVAPDTPREAWRTGIAADLGIENPTMTGFPFSAVVIKKTTDGKVYPVVRFSPDGDPVQWLLSQRRQRLELGGVVTLALGAATVNDPDYVDHARHMDRAELDGVIIEGSEAELVTTSSVLPENDLRVETALLTTTATQVTPAPSQRKKIAVVEEATSVSEAVWDAATSIDGAKVIHVHAPTDPQIVIPQTMDADQQAKVRHEASMLGVSLEDVENAYGGRLDLIAVDGKDSAALLADILQEVQRRARQRKGGKR